MQAFMFNVQLPTNSTAVAAALQQRLDVDYDTYIVVVTLGDIVYTRLSAQVGGKGERVRARKGRRGKRERERGWKRGREGGRGKGKERERERRV